jgi:hypothetical protein
MKRAMLPGRTIVAAALASTGMLMTQAVLSAEAAYSVISPLGEDTAKMVPMAKRLDALSNKTTVCMVSNNDFKANITIPVIMQHLKDTYPGIKVIPPNEFPNAFSGTRWDAVSALYRSKGCNAVIAGNGG